jgi:indole-3-glycerol phosphate synthase
MMPAVDFLDSMAEASRARAAAARAQVPEAVLRDRISQLPPPPSLRLTGAFDLIAELKFRSPAYGALHESSGDLESRVLDYGRSGAAIVSVLTEPDRFDGSLDHLERASRALRTVDIPTMRKDFLVDAYQLLEARAAGAGGVLLIIRMLPEDLLASLLAAAVALGLFVLLEAFDAKDIETARALSEVWRGPRDHLLIGVNSRDLATLHVVPDRLDTLVSRLPETHARVAESGLRVASDAERLARCGYTVALVGSALMQTPDPGALVRAMVEAGRHGAASRGTG